MSFGRSDMGSAFHQNGWGNSSSVPCSGGWRVPWSWILVHLLEPRPVEKKLLGNCRDHSLLLTALLGIREFRRAPVVASVPISCLYHFEDHWVTEYWNQEQSRWVFVDAQLDALQCEVLKIDFDTLDVPRGQFIVGGKAWKMCRSREQNPDKFGIFDMHGLGFVRGNFVRDQLTQ